MSDRETPATDWESLGRTFVDDRLDARLYALRQAVLRVRTAARDGERVSGDDLEAVYSELDDLRMLLDRVAADVPDTPHPIDQSAYMDYDALVEEYDRNRAQSSEGVADD